MAFENVVINTYGDVVRQIINDPDVEKKYAAYLKNINSNGVDENSRRILAIHYPILSGDGLEAEAA